MGDGVGEEEVQWRAAAIAGDVLDDPARLSRPTKSASVSSSCGGHAISWCSRNADAADRDRADPDPERVRGDERAHRGDERARSRERLRLSVSSGFAPHLRW